MIVWFAMTACGMAFVVWDSLFNGDYWKAVRKTCFAETISMNLVMTGMIPAMLFLGITSPGSEAPLNPEFWFRMSLAMIGGGVIAYPVTITGWLRTISSTAV